MVVHTNSKWSGHLNIQTIICKCFAINYFIKISVINTYMDEIRQIMNKTITTNFDLEKLTAFLGMRTWIGMRDEFTPQVLVSYDTFILNIQPSSFGGMHWTALFKKKVGEKYQCTFFDPYGSSPMDSIVKACKREGIQLSYSNNIYQAFKSELCGFFCVCFLLCMSKGIPFKRFDKLMSDKEERNDVIVKRIINRELLKLNQN